MKVRMRAAISGTRDGEHWPAPGEVVDLPQHEAEHMVAAALAEPVAATAKPEPEKATAPKATTRKR